ncbi:MAG: flagellar biosynthetic protein FliQ [Planctomycetes bacterium]|nr:flagellar biosynthetic protein FliQ [Planctomycetota bacterium]
MGPEEVISITNNMLWTAFLISMPMLLTALGVGVFVSLIQTVTGVQEMTLTFVPKILGILIALLIFMPWMSTVLINFSTEIFVRIAGG